MFVNIDEEFERGEADANLREPETERLVRRI